MPIDKKEGWFHTENRVGDRTLDQQMVGLDRLVTEVRGKTVLDLGCAEGLVSFQLCKAGAKSVYGVEIVKGHVIVARSLTEDKPCTFERANLNEWAPKDKYDIALMLAILHKLEDPSGACRRFAEAARDLVVIRLPPSGLVIRDIRSNNVPHDIGAVMRDAGFDLEHEGTGTFDEWIGYFRRRKPVEVQPEEPEQVGTVTHIEDAPEQAHEFPSGDPATPSVDTPEDAPHSEGGGHGLYPEDPIEPTVTPVNRRGRKKAEPDAPKRRRTDEEPTTEGG